jgi:polysaccharide biosynthesis transport protein
MSSHSIDLRAYVDILLRRRAVIGSLFGSVFALSLLLAWSLPAVYRSTATILIEEQEIPTDLVRSTITSYADQRIETIKQQVLSRTTLWKLVEQYRLYPALRERSAAEDVLARLTRDIEVQVINADVVDKRTQHPTKATIAFTLAYSGESPEAAQKVANELTTLFLGENLKSRERKVQETTSFLKQEAEHLARSIEEVETKLAAVKRRADGALPELTQLNMQLLNQADRELADLEREIRTQEERRSYLESQLATIKPHTPIIAATGERILDAAERLKALRAQYAGAAAYLAPEHPDIVKMKQEIQALEREAGEAGGARDLAKRLSGERAALAELAQRFGPEHPDVRRSRQVIGALERERARQIARAAQAEGTAPENPAYITIQAQLAATVSSLDALKGSRASLKRRVQDYAGRLERTPAVEPEYLELTRERDGAAAKYQEIRSRLMEAQVAEGLEVQRKGERFSLIDPPDLPAKPDKPNRPVIVFLGFVFAVGAALGGGAVTEQLDRSIHSAEQIRRLTQAMPLAVIQRDVRRALRRRRQLRWGAAGTLAGSLLLAHWYWQPLDVLWLLALRKLGLS